MFLHEKSGHQKVQRTVAASLANRWNLRTFTSTYIGNRRRTRINQLELWRGRRVFFPLEKVVVRMLRIVIKVKGF